MFESTISPPELSLTDQLRQAVQKCDTFPALVSVESNLPPLAWLRAQSDDVKLCWSNRDSDEVIVGSGVAANVIGRDDESVDDILNRCRSILNGCDDLRFFGGFSFRRDTEPRGAWQKFDRSQFWLPRLFADNGTIGCVVLNPNDVPLAVEAVSKMKAVADSSIVSIEQFTERQDIPDEPLWNYMINDAIGLFEKEVLEKIVLARRADFRFAQALDPVSLISKLREATPACYHFCFQLNSRLAFVGATPERLFTRRESRLLSEVVAGTRRRGENAKADQALEAELLNSSKDQLEHDIVRKSIRQRLHKLVDSLEVDSKASILKLARKQHLYSSVQASLKPDVTDGQLFDTLHPTPAVGGYPVENALTEIDRLEPFDRGWYAAPIGWVSPDEAEFAVAIRSGLISDNVLSLYSGAGIVPGSTPSQEWDEIEHKISDFLDVMDSN